MTEWRSLEPAAALELMRGYARPWWVGGAWALDLFLGGRTREHADLDVALPRRDLAALREQFEGWDLRVAHHGELIAWAGEPLEPPRHVLWARRDAGTPWELELLLMEADGRTWRFRRDPAITLPLARVGLERDGIPFLTPEIPLLYKSKAPRAHDEADFAAVLPALDGERRAWLAGAIGKANPRHPWVVALAAE